MTSGCLPAKDTSGPDEILETLREAVSDSPRLTEMPTEEVVRQLALDCRLQEEPSPVLVADTLGGCEAEEGDVDADELSEEGPRLRVIPIMDSTVGGDNFVVTPASCRCALPCGKRSETPPRSASPPRWGRGRRSR